MVNVTVINLKTIIKYLVGVIVIIIGITCTKFFYEKGKSNINMQSIDLTSCLDETLPDIEGRSSIRKLSTATTSRGSNLKRMLDVNLPMMGNLIVDGEEDGIKSEEPNMVDESEENIELAETGIDTQQITENNIEGKYNTTYQNIKIKNESRKRN